MSIEVEMELVRLRNERQQLVQANEHLQRGCRPRGWLEKRADGWHSEYVAPDPVRGLQKIDRPVGSWAEGIAFFDSMRRVVGA
ncbi:MAG: hypothetical protein GEU74_12340 [Nitriliruptorales bacterium]|nr:hypothetical protein [Nitriliruptorales bacterium]